MEDIRLDSSFDIVTDGTGDADTVVDSGYLRQRVAILAMNAAEAASTPSTVRQRVKRTLDNDGTVPSPVRVSVDRQALRGTDSRSVSLDIELPNATIKLPLIE